MGYIKKRATAPFNGRVDIEGLRELSKPSNARYDREIEVAAAGVLYPDANLDERVDDVLAGNIIGETPAFVQKVKDSVCVVNFSCTHGSVGATVDGMGIQSGAYVGKGKSVVFTITPDEGYEYTGTNPETVVVNAPITKAYECTMVIDKPACIRCSGWGAIHARYAARDDDNPHIHGLTKMYAWAYGGEIFGTASESPSVGDLIYRYENSAWTTSTLSVNSVALGPCMSCTINGGDIPHSAYEPAESTHVGYYAWTYDTFYSLLTTSLTPSVGDKVYNDSLQENGTVLIYSNIT